MESHYTPATPGSPGAFLYSPLADNQPEVSLLYEPANFASATLLGFTYGLLNVVGPDHLGTLVSLSAAAAPQKAFSVGAAWSLGHCTGMVCVAFLIVLLRKVMHVNVDAWEHVGNYAIGVSMILCGTYFAMRESKYLKEEADGTISLRSCDCHGSGAGKYGAVTRSETEQEGEPGNIRERSKDRDGIQRRRFCSTYEAHQSPGSNDPSCTKDCCTTTSDNMSAWSSADEPPEARPESPVPPPPPASQAAATAALTATTAQAEGSRADSQEERQLRGKTATGDVEWDFTSAVLGILQGVCCPMGLVGVAFLSSLRGYGVALFLAAFLLTSAVGTGTLAFVWAFLLRRQALSRSTSKMMYRVSCCFTLLFGGAWIFANYFSFIDKLNYAEHALGKEQALGM
mmetsp:Transcript_67474/g.170213  ORF Transcript_67474/g.170213 Transcript_67474/m.170213 type:complete len:399 (-) Transcript_67474:105-1301(-)